MMVFLIVDEAYQGTHMASVAAFHCSFVSILHLTMLHDNDAATPLQHTQLLAYAFDWCSLTTLPAALLLLIGIPWCISSCP